MRTALRTLSVVLLAMWLGGVWTARAGETPEQRMKPGHCGCQASDGCWHYLRAPMKLPEDPCRCGLCTVNGNCSGRPLPKDWSLECANCTTPECFWKRHAASWGIACSRCALGGEPTPCDGLPGAPNAAVKKQLEHQFDLEMSVGVRKEDVNAKKRGIVAWSKHFYLVCDMPQLRIFTQAGGQQFIETHEIVHLFLQRAEQAFDDFVAVWGDEIRLDKPMAIYMAERMARKDAWRALYFGAGKTQMVYAGAEGKIAGGFCWNGFAVSLDDYDKDRDLHGYVRHMIGHILFSCWHGVGGFNKECPRWAFSAAADWLARSNPLTKDFSTFCQEEGNSPSGSGKDWDDKAHVLAAKPRIPIDKLFAVASLSHLSYDDYIREWSYFDVMLREDRARWLAVMRVIREGKEHSAAFRQGLGMTPEEFDARWADRMLGKRKTMAESARDTALTESTGGVDAAERRRILSEKDPETLAQLLRGLERVRDVKTAELVASRVSADSDILRETVTMLFEKTQAPEVVEWMRTAGLSDSNAIVRACVARALATLKDAAARPRLEALLDDTHWLVRANAAKALGDIGDPASVPVLVAHVEDRNPKAWIAKADAMSRFGRAASAATKAVAERLSASDWQVRLTACRALTLMGNEDAVEPLIDRFEVEVGRIHRELYRALRAVSFENFGPNPQTWRNWWKAQKPHGLPAPPPPDVKHNPEDDRYAPPVKRTPPRPEDQPTYYGRRIFSESILFVMDVSRSMELVIEIPEDAQKKLGTIPKGQRIEVARSAIKSAIGKLDPRARFNIVFFSTIVHPWKSDLVLAGPSRDAALSAVDAAGLEDETNIFGALRASVGLHEKPTLSAELDPIPDTIYFLTDGTPTRGEIMDTETILSWMRDVNRFAKVELNVIAMGSLGLDLPFLRRLAAENGGEFTHIPDHK
jgi:HEAT repeat protein